MSAIICDQSSILPDECVECGGWLHRERKGGFTDGGFRYCSEDCIANYQQAQIDMAEQLARTCDICGRQRGKCKTEDDPHEFEGRRPYRPTAKESSE